jgi:hypothetical protein
MQQRLYCLLFLGSISAISLYSTYDNLPDEGGGTEWVYKICPETKINALTFKEQYSSPWV